MSECNSFEEYKMKFFANQKVSGVGMETTMHVPCAFCGEPDFIVHRVIESEQAYARGAVCSHCGRGARGVITRDRGGISCEFVQTSGPLQPAWLPPMRVLSSE